MKIDNPMGKTKYWRRLLHPPELAAFALKYNRHRLRFPWVRPALERLFMDRVKDRYRSFDPQQQLWQTIAIQTIDDCNGRCCFCPNSLLKRTKAKMNMDTFGRIIGELEELDYRDAIVLDLQCGDALQEIRAELMNNVRAGLCGKCDEMGYRPRMRAVETVPVMEEAPALCSAETHERSVVSSVPYRDGDN